MLLASHNMVEVERMCDDVVMLREGSVVDQGSPADLVARYGRGTMEEVFLDVARGRDDAAVPLPQRDPATPSSRAGERGTDSP
jgi:ABC-2 type transport system ATP-binding protein